MTGPAGASRRKAFLAAAPADRPHTVLALDFDGTLAPLVSDPEQSRPAPGAMSVLAGLGDAGYRVAIVTGRAPQTVARLAGLDKPADRPPPGLRHMVIHGHYGMQRWTSAEGLRSEVSDDDIAAVDRVRVALPDLLAQHDAPDGVTVEDKDVSLVVHTRRTKDPQATLEALTPALAELAEQHGLRVEPGRFVCELRPYGADKGGVMAELIAAHEAVTALYAGDDLGDLPAFAALADASGHGVRTLAVASGQQHTDPRVEAAADLTVDGPTGVVELLRDLLRRG